MARISPRAMNNVVIFAMLAMMFLFNINSFLPESQEPTVQPLIPQESYILKIVHDQYQVERVGQQWRWKGLNAPLSGSPESQINAFKRAQLLPSVVPDTTAIGEPLIVVVWLAGAAEGKVYAFYPDAKEVWVAHNKQWYTLEGVSLSDLLPWL